MPSVSKLPPKPVVKSISSPSGFGGKAGPNGTSETRKKLGSLSSFQPTLNFRAAPTPSTFSTASRPTLSTSSSDSPSNHLSRGNGISESGPSSSHRNRIPDEELMPPPPLGVKTKYILLQSSTGSMKGKQKEVIDFLDSDEEPDTVKIGSTRKRTSPKSLQSNETARHETASGMWTEIYAPKTERDLAPGKARIDRVKNWLSEALYGIPAAQLSGEGSPMNSAADKVRRYRRILLMTGPAGTGKTTTIRVLAEQMGVDLEEWGEGVEERSIGSGFERDSPASKLASWLSRHSYQPLNMSDTTGSSNTVGSGSTQSRRVLLLTSIPNLGHLSTRDAFHEALLSFCSTYTSSSCPLIIIHSDAGLGGKAEESWMERDRGGREGAAEVVGKAVRDGPYCMEVDFIPLAPTFVTKALNKVLDRAKIPSENSPPQSAVQLIAMTSNGDLRSAVNSLQFLCGRKSDKETSGQKRKGQDGEHGVSGKARKISRGSGKGSRGGKGVKLDVSKDLRAVLDAVSRREQSLGLFHALGKVFYNKRLGDPPLEADDQEEIDMIRLLPAEDPLPSHLREFERTKSRIIMDSFISTIPVDASSFALWIHQSLPAFCGEIEEVSMAYDELCAADIMRTDDDIWHSSPQSIAYSLHLTIRGALMALPSPVKRNHQKIIKPQFFEAFRKERDNMELLETATGYIVKKAVVASTILSDRALNSDETDVGILAPWGGMLSKTTLAGEMIPMMVKIQNLTDVPLLPAAAKPLSFKPYSQIPGSTQGFGNELTAKDTDIDEDDLDDSMAGEDGLGVIGLTNGRGWDESGEGIGEEVRENAWLEDDEIQDWD